MSLCGDIPLKNVSSLFRYRALIDISANEGPSAGFELLSNSVITMSTTLVAHELQIRILTDQLMLTRCQQAEEACGRINVDNLNRMIIVGGPYLPLSEQLQAKLRSQVRNTTNEFLIF